MTGTTGEEREPDKDQQLVDDLARLAGALGLLFGGRSGEKPTPNLGHDAGSEPGSEVRPASETELRLLKTALEAGKSVVGNIFGQIVQELGPELRQEWDGLMSELESEIAAKRQPTE